MGSINLDDLKLEYQKLSDPDKFIKYAKDNGAGLGINRYKSAQSYWADPTETDSDFPNIYQYHFPLFYQMLKELEHIFETKNIPQFELYATICTATLFKNMPHIMLLWERRKCHNLKDHTLNTHELCGCTTGSSLNNSNQSINQSQSDKGIPEDLRYTII